MGTYIGRPLRSFVHHLMNSAVSCCSWHECSANRTLSRIPSCSYSTLILLSWTHGAASSTAISVSGKVKTQSYKMPDTKCRAVFLALSIGQQRAHNALPPTHCTLDRASSLSLEDLPSWVSFCLSVATSCCMAVHSWTQLMNCFRAKPGTASTAIRTAGGHLWKPGKCRRYRDRYKTSQQMQQKPMNRRC